MGQNSPEDLDQNSPKDSHNSPKISTKQQDQECVIAEPAAPAAVVKRKILEVSKYGPPSKKRKRETPNKHTLTITEMFEKSRKKGELQK